MRMLFMVPLRCLLLLVMVLSGLASHAGAAGEAASPARLPGARLDLDTAMRLALQSHPTLEQRRAAIAAAEAELSASEWKRYPALAATSFYQGAGSTNGYTVSVTQPLWTGGRITGEISSRREQQAAAEAALVEGEQDLLQRVAQAFSEVLRLTARVQVAQSNIAEHERLVGVIRRRTEGDLSAAVDVALAEGRLRQARLDALQAASQRQVLLASLGQLVGAPVNTELVTPSSLRGPWSEAEAAIDAALAYSPALRRLEADAAAADAQAQVAASALWPQISLRVQRSANVPVTVASETRAMMLLEYQSGGGFSVAASRDAALRRSLAARAAVESARRDLREQVTARFQEARLASEALTPTREYAAANASVIESYLRQFAAGRKSWLEVVNAQRELAQAQLAVADAEAAERLATLRLALVTGWLGRASLLR